MSFQDQVGAENWCRRTRRAQIADYRSPGSWGKPSTEDQVGVDRWPRSMFVGSPGVGEASASTHRASGLSYSSCWCGRRSLLTSLPFPPTKARITVLKPWDETTTLRASLRFIFTMRAFDEQLVYANRTQIVAES